MPLQYWVVAKKTAKELSDEVSQFINDGWTLHGGVAVSVRIEDLDGTYNPQYGKFSGKIIGSTTTFAQALVKEVE